MKRKKIIRERWNLKSTELQLTNVTSQHGVRIHLKKSGDNFYFWYYLLLENTNKSNSIAEEDDNYRVCYALLDDIETKFDKLTNKSKSNVNSLLQDRLKYFNNPENDKIKKLKSQVGELKDIMIDNIDKVLERGDTLDRLIDATEDLSGSAEEFRRGTKKLKWAMTKRQIILITAGIAVILAIVLIIIFIACGFPTFERCRASSSK